MLALIRMVLSFVDPADHRRLLGLVAMMLGTALLEMGNLGLVVVLLKMLDSPRQMAAMLPAPLSDWSNERLVVAAVSVFGGFFLVKTVAVWAMTSAINNTAAAMMARFETRVFRHQLCRSYLGYLTSTSTTTLQTTVINSYRAFEALRVLFSILIESLLMLATGILLLLVQPAATLACGVLLVLLGVAFHRVLGPMFQRFGTELVRSEASLFSTAIQAFHSFRPVKIHHAERYFERIFYQAANRDTHFRARSTTFQAVPRLLLEAVMILGFVLAILVILATQGNLDGVVSTLGLFAMASLRLLPSFNRVLQYVGDLRQRETPIRQLHRDLAIFSREPEEEDVGEVKPLGFERDLILDGVGFTYPNAQRPALTDINLAIRCGDSVGLVGASGAGKSSLAEIILGLLPPTEGRLLVDGNDVSADRARWQANLGYVPQQVYLLDGTVRRNIAFGIDDADIDDDRVWSALRGAQMEDVIRALPSGLDAELGENAQWLSGGQRQRLGIARALYRDPEVLMFDEATSALDNETERNVSAAIEGLMGSKTLIVIAHRLSTVRHCSTIVFLSDGRILEQGRFDDLLARSPEFRAFVNTADRDACAVPPNAVGEDVRTES